MFITNSEDKVKTKTAYAPIKRRLEFIFNILPTDPETLYKNILTKESIKGLCDTVKETLNIDWDVLTKSDDNVLVTFKDLIREEILAPALI